MLGSVAAIAAGATLAALSALLRRTLLASAAPEGAVYMRTRAVAAVAALAFFVLASVLFARFAASIEQEIGAGRRPERAYEFVNTFNVLDMKYACAEYTAVTGFEAARDALRDFMLRQPGMTARRLRC